MTQSNDQRLAGRTPLEAVRLDPTRLPASPVGSDRHRAMPFWSLRSRADRAVATVPAYAGLEPAEIPLEDFRSRWLPGLKHDGLRVGVNWSGERATGYDIAAPEVEENLAAATRGLDATRD